LESLRYYDKIQIADDKLKLVWPVIYIHPTNDILKIITPWRTPEKLEQSRTSLGDNFDEILINMERFSHHLSERYTRKLSLAFTIFYGERCDALHWSWMLFWCNSARSIFFSLNVFRRPETATLSDEEEVQDMIKKFTEYRDLVRGRKLRSPPIDCTVTESIESTDLSRGELKGDIGVLTTYPAGLVLQNLGLNTGDFISGPNNRF
jgi:hypothetical protein